MISPKESKPNGILNKKKNSVAQACDKAIDNDEFCEYCLKHHGTVYSTSNVSRSLFRMAFRSREYHGFSEVNHVPRRSFV